jgi:hypothetical protein
MAYAKKKVKVANNHYEITLLPGSEAYKISYELMNKASGLVTAYAMADPAVLTKGLKDILSPEDMFLLFDRVVNPNELRCNNELVLDIDEHFSGKPLEMNLLMIEALKANCSDFFTLSAGLMEKVKKEIAKHQPNLSKNPGTEEALNKMAQGLGLEV